MSSLRTETGPWSDTFSYGHNHILYMIISYSHIVFIGCRWTYKWFYMFFFFYDMIISYSHIILLGRQGTYKWWHDQKFMMFLISKSCLFLDFFLKDFKFPPNILSYYNIVTLKWLKGPDAPCWSFLDFFLNTAKYLPNIMWYNITDIIIL